MRGSKRTHGDEGKTRDGEGADAQDTRGNAHDYADTGLQTLFETTDAMITPHPHTRVRRRIWKIRDIFLAYGTRFIVTDCYAFKTLMGL